MRRESSLRKSWRTLHGLLQWVIPPREWQLPVYFVTAVFAGLGLFVLYVSNAFSYLSDNPATCINCHIMVPQYAAWQHSSHREVATCNDCHVPQDNPLRGYLFKAEDGLRHSAIFTMRNEPHAIFMREAGREAVHENCIRCHSQLVHHPQSGLSDSFEQRACWECHRDVPHGRVRSLASAPYARAPLLKSVIPDWVQQALEAEKKRP